MVYLNMRFILIILGTAFGCLGLALISCNMYSLFIPLGLFLVFIFDYIPKSDDYLQKKYGNNLQCINRKQKN
ncbi:putative membrane protein [Bacillus cereus]|nr:putative membrane protein [Bacillus cereus]AJG95981.1 putative membrane protein [Bacillus cereus]AJI05739.1 putative membrane protein [Bacillus cereus G9241]